jgi:CelD/BcsL family acetyltransferase involved in cellulose biosynthesis
LCPGIAITLNCAANATPVVTLEVIESISLLVEIEPEWFAFVRTLAGITPFQLPRWLLIWWRHFGNGQLHVLVFRENDAIVGIVPCFRHQWNGLRQLTLIGSGISDYLEPAIDSQHCPAILDRLRTHLEVDTDWDVCDWQDLSSNTPLTALKSDGKFKSVANSDIPCSEVRLSGTFDEFRNARPKDLKRNLRRYRNKAEALGSLLFEVEKDARPDLMQALVELHSAKWERRGEPGMIQANGSAEFLCEIATEFALRDMLRIFTLRFEGRIVAVIVAFSYEKTIFGYLSAFDPEHESLGFGRTLLFEALRYCYDNDYEAWNFLRGDEPYKFWWGAQLIPKSRVRLTRTNG